MIINISNNNKIIEEEKVEIEKQNKSIINELSQFSFKKSNINKQSSQSIMTPTKDNKSMDIESPIMFSGEKSNRRAFSNRDPLPSNLQESKIDIHEEKDEASNKDTLQEAKKTINSDINLKVTTAKKREKPKKKEKTDPFKEKQIESIATYLFNFMKDNKTNAITKLSMRNSLNNLKIENINEENVDVINNING